MCPCTLPWHHILNGGCRDGAGAATNVVHGHGCMFPLTQDVVVVGCAAAEPPPHEQRMGCYGLALLVAWVLFCPRALQAPTPMFDASRFLSLDQKKDVWLLGGHPLPRLELHPSDRELLSGFKIFVYDVHPEIGQV